MRRLSVAWAVVEAARGRSKMATEGEKKKTTGIEEEDPCAPIALKVRASINRVTVLLLNLPSSSR